MTDYEGALAGILAASIGILIFVLILVIAWAVFYYVGMWKMYKKAGKEGWKCLIPLYNNWVLVEMVGLEWYWFLIIMASTIASLLGLVGIIGTLASIATIVGNVAMLYNLSKKFNKSTGWIVLSVFFSGITLPILGYSNSDTWNNDAVVTANGPFDAKKETETKSEEK